LGGGTVAGGKPTLLVGVGPFSAFFSRAPRRRGRRRAPARGRRRAAARGRGGWPSRATVARRRPLVCGLAASCLFCFLVSDRVSSWVWGPRPRGSRRATRRRHGRACSLPPRGCGHAGRDRRAAWHPVSGGCLAPRACVMPCREGGLAPGGDFKRWRSLRHLRLLVVTCVSFRALPVGKQGTRHRKKKDR